MTKYHKFLITVFAAVWIWAAIAPNYREDWLFENILVILFVPAIIWSGRYLRLSNLSYTLITVFSVLQLVGSHYTFAEVPFGRVLADWFGAERNSYDRLVHFLWGLLILYPAREIIMRAVKVVNGWSYYFAFDVIVSLSAIFEIFEWVGARLVSAELGTAYLGMQGDIFDAQKDMAMAALGALAAVAIILLTRNKILNPGDKKI